VIIEARVLPAISAVMPYVPPSPRQRIPGRPTDGGDRFTPRGLLPRLFSRMMIALMVIWIVLMILHMWS
jgi:hypothetical protein